MEEKDDFGNVAEMDDCIEEFILEINKAKAGPVLYNSKDGVNVNLKRDLMLEHQTELKESSNTSL